MEVSGHRSTTRFLGDYGAPQGSILAGLLYLIYANDIPDKRENKKTIQFVDDTTEMIKANNTQVLKQKLQEEADSSIMWMSNNRMKISESKTKIIVSSTRALRSLHQQPVEVKIKGINIQ